MLHQFEPPMEVTNFHLTRDPTKHRMPLTHTTCARLQFFIDRSCPSRIVELYHEEVCALFYWGFGLICGARIFAEEDINAAYISVVHHGCHTTVGRDR